MLALLGFTLAELRMRPGRTLLTMAATSIGVATVVAVSLGIAGARHAIKDLNRTVGGNASREVISATGNMFNIAVIDKLQGLPGIAAVSPIIESQATFYDRDRKKVTVRLLGVDQGRDTPFRKLHFREGAFPGDGELAITKQLADRFGLQTGTKVRLQTRRGFEWFNISGQFEIRGEGVTTFEHTMLMSLPEVQYWYKRDEKVSRVLLLFDPAAEPAEVTQAVASQLPPGLAVRNPASRGQLGANTLYILEQGFQIVSALALVIAFFISLNAFTMNVAERRRQLAVIRLIGGTQLQTRLAVLLEGSSLGLIGAVLGLPLGILASRLILLVFEVLYQADLPVPEVTPVALTVGLVLGIVTSGLASFLPAQQASRVVPLEALTAVERQGGQKWLRWSVLAGSGLTLVSLGVIAGCIAGLIHVSVALPAAIVWLIGLSGLIPAVWRPLSWVASLPIRALASVEVMLAHESLLQRPVRTMMSAAVLFIGMAASIGILNTTLNNIASVRNYANHTISGDYIIRPLNIRRDPEASPDLPAEVEAAVRKLPGIQTVEAVRYAEVLVNEESVFLIAREFPSNLPIQLDVPDADPEQLRTRLRAGEVAVGTALLNRLGKQPGDMLQINTSRGTQEFRIAAGITEYIAGGMAIVIDRECARRQFDLDGTDVLIIRAAPSARADLGPQLAKLTEEAGLLLQTRAELNAALDQALLGVERSLFAMLLVCVILTGFGVVNCLTLNIIEQSREFGTLRALGMTRGQLRRVVLVQGWLFSLVAVLLAVPVGLLLSYLGALGALAMFGNTMDFAIHPLSILGFALLAVAVILACTCFPAMRASRLAPLESLRIE
jgi:putative ABC transport system permease protein